MSTNVISVPSTVTEMSPERWLFEFETYGKVNEGCNDPNKLYKYKKGKAERDWWNKEKLEWKKLGCIYIPEEFTEFLIPDCFFELFDHYPRTHLVRYYYDNNYTEEEFKSDLYHLTLGLDHERDGYRIIYSKFQQTPQLVAVKENAGKTLEPTTALSIEP